MKISLVMATLGREREVQRFLAALDVQTYHSFELIVVDQNPDDRLVPLLSSFQSRFPVLHLRSGKRGLSKSRNVGLEYITGDVVGFPDDDCRYPPHFFERVVRFLQEHPNVDGVTGRTVDELGVNCARFDMVPGLITLSNAWARATSSCIFLRSGVVKKVGRFDETLGVGAGTIWGGGEDIDYPLRAVEAGFKLHYDPNLIALQPTPFKHSYRELASRAFSYGAGIGRVWRKHNYPIWLVAYHLLRPAGGAILSIIAGRREKASYHWSAFRGRLRGWLSK